VPPLGERRSQDEAARFDAGHRVRLGPLSAAEQAVKGFHGLAEVRAEQWRYVTEQDAGLREIGDIDHVARQRVHRILVNAGNGGTFW